MPDSKNTVLVYADRILSGSATFIKAQFDNVNGYSTIYVGTRRAQEGHGIAEDCCVVLNEGSFLGRFREIIYKVAGIAPFYKSRLETLSPSLIHAHFGPDGVMALPLSRALDIPLLVTFHGYDATTSDAHARQSFYRHRAYVRNRDRLIDHASGFIAVSNFIKTEMIKQGIPEKKIDVHYIGIDVDFFEPDKVGGRDPVVLFVGRLVEKKGLLYLIQAMERVQETNPNVRLVVIGDGERRAELESEAARRLKNAEFLGFQSQNVVWEWMNRAMLLGVPSVTAESGDSEGLPMVVLEGQAMGLPVVGSEHAGLPEAILHGETGLLAPERDWNTLADHIQRLVEDRSLRETFGQNGRERVLESFNLKKQARALEDLYRSHGA